MEQHPIPQQISNYEFKLVGEMTLKQFGKAAGGIIIALIINSTGIVFFIRYPLMALFGGGGLLMAFVPYEDRPLETWAIAFLRSIYSPTIYFYKKRSNKNWLDIDYSKNIDVANDNKEEDEVRAVKDEQKVKEFIESLPSVKRETVNEEPEEIKDEKANVLQEAAKEVILPTPTKRKEKIEAEENWKDQKVDLNLKTEKLTATGKVKFGTIPMPDIPDTPNIIVGMVTDIEGKIVEGAIVEIQDESGNPSRVLKTNTLGQFRISAPLANGRYLIITEKEGHNFDRVNVDLDGNVVEPVKIIAKGI